MRLLVYKLSMVINVCKTSAYKFEVVGVGGAKKETGASINIILKKMRTYFIFILNGFQFRRVLKLLDKLRIYLPA